MQGVVSIVLGQGEVFSIKAEFPAGNSVGHSTHNATKVWVVLPILKTKNDMAWLCSTHVRENILENTGFFYFDIYLGVYRVE